MSSSIREYVLQHPLFSHHDHHITFPAFEAGRESFGYRDMLGYASADLETAEGGRPGSHADEDARVVALWPRIRTTGYGRAVTLTCRELFDLEYCPKNFPAVTKALQAVFRGRTTAEIYEYLICEKANNKWLVQDGLFRPGQSSGRVEDMPLDCYRFAWRMDSLCTMVDAEPIEILERETGISILTLDRLVDAMNASIDHHKATGRLASLKNGMAYARDLVVGDPTRHEAEAAFNRIRNRKSFHDGIQQNAGAVDAAGARPLGDYLFHRMMQRAGDDDLPVQIHTGYLAGTWKLHTGVNASHLAPIFEKYRRVRFDIFHASWPWSSELGAMAKNYPNVYPDLCWAWTMNPAQSQQALSEWLDAVPFNKIFGYGADTGQPWCNTGYALQARIGIARVLEEKIEAGYFSQATAEEVASAIMLRNGEEFYGLE